jgi:HAD superfamily hydrolase (TIGR01509 family)
MIDLVIFDCDGVLIDSEVISAHMLIGTLADHGVSVDMAYVAEHFLGRSYPTVLKQVRTEFGIDLPDSFEEDYRQRLLDAFECELKIMPDVRGVIENLGVPYALATSSSPRRLAMSMALTGLADLFAGRMFTASEVSRGKPAPDLFYHVAAKMGVQPAQCLVIEDSLNGILAGQAAGMEVWRFTGGSHISAADRSGPTTARAHLSFDRFAGFFDVAPTLRRPD